jgi:hypothetical protein
MMMEGAGKRPARLSPTQGHAGSRPWFLSSPVAEAVPGSVPGSSLLLPNSVSFLVLVTCLPFLVACSKASELASAPPTMQQAPFLAVDSLPVAQPLSPTPDSNLEPVTPTPNTVCN